MPLTIPSSIGEITGIRRTVVGVLAAGLISAAFAPSWFWALLVGVVLAGITALAYRHLPAVCAAWTLVAGCTLEITLADLVGPAAFQPTIAVVKGAGIILAMMAIARFGFRPDVFNPASAFTVMFAGGLAHGLHPELSLTDSLRSLIGSVAPFAFSFSRLSPGWSAWIIRTAPWIPVVGVAAALVLQLFGLRPMFVDSGGLRLTGLGHPAFLAGACLVGIYASLIMLFRDGRRTHVTMLALNFLLLVLTGARAPLFYAVAVTGLSLALVRSPNWPIRSRVCIVLPLLVALPWLLPVAEGGTEVRALSLTLSDPGNLSGRDLLWPYFEELASKSPWIGWGVGAGNVAVPPESGIIRLMHTWAAHNEYLRIEVEGGLIGSILLFALFTLWAWRHSAPLRQSDRVVIRLVFIAFACHAYTDNVLISSSACVLFTFVSAVFALGRESKPLLINSARCA